MKIFFFIKFENRKKLFTGTVPVRNLLYTGTVPACNLLYTGTVPVTNLLFTGTLEVGCLYAMNYSLVPLINDKDAST